MKVIAKRKVQNVLRKQFNLRPLKRGDGTDHELWSDQYGRTCRPVFCRKDVPYRYLYCLGNELETKGIASRTEFLAAIRAA